MSPNMTLSWVLALVPEIGLLILLAIVLLYDRIIKPVGLLVQHGQIQARG